MSGTKPYFAFLALLCLFIAARQAPAQVSVRSVDGSSVAQAAGIQPGDILSRWTQGENSGPFSSPLELSILFTERFAGPTAFYGVRNGREISWQLPLAQTIYGNPFGLDVEFAAPQIKAIFDHFDSLIKANQFTAAASYAQAQAALFSAADGTRSEILYTAAQRLVSAGHFKPEAAPLFADASRTAPTTIPYLKPAIDSKWAASASGGGDPADDLFLRAVAEWEKVPHWPLNLASTLRSFASYCSQAGRFSKAIDLDERALQIARSVAPGTVLVALSLRGLGNVYGFASDLDLADKNLQEALTIAESLHTKTQETGEIYAGLTRIAFHRSEFALAESFSLRGLASLKGVPGSERTSQITLYNLGSLAAQSGSYSRAIYFFTRSVAVARRGDSGDQFDLATALRGLADAEISTGELDTAEPHLRESIGILERIAPASEVLIRALHTMGELHQGRGNLAEAAKVYQRSLKMAIARDSHGELVADTRGHLGFLYLEMRQPQLAVLQCGLALAYNSKVSPDDFDSADNLQCLAEAAQALHHPQSAIRYYARASAIFEKQRSVFGRADQVQSENWSASLPERYAALLFGQNQTARGFEVLDHSRARTLLVSLAAQHFDLRKNVPAALLEQDRKLEESLADLAEQRTQLLAKNPAKAAALTSQITAASAEHDIVENRISAANPNFDLYNTQKPISISAVQHLLDPETALLEYSIDEKGSYLVAIARTQMAVYPLTHPAQITILAKSVYKQWSSPSAAAPNPNPAIELSKLVLAPAAGFIRSKHRLVIVPDGALAYIPFAALPSPLSPSGSPLANQFEIVSLPSASLLAVLRQQRPNPRQPSLAAGTIAVLADPVFSKDDPRVTNSLRPQLVADSGTRAAATDDDDEISLETIDTESRGLHLNRLPHTREEAEAIASVVPKNRLFLALDFDANRAAALNPEIQHARIVHFATHGIFDEKNPALSGLTFSITDKYGKPQPGFLGLDAIYSSHFSADLVVLSACETALGEEVSGEGLVGLTWGFIYAGAKSVVASLWRVNDASTAELMRLFYDGMERRGLPPSAALHEAQLAISQKPQWSSPYYWAGFVIEGDYGR